MRSQKILFKNHNNARLGARLDLPDKRTPEYYALFAHCFTCTKNLKAIGNINRALTDDGIAVLRFDFTGLGESEGDFADTNFTTNVDDLVSAAEFLEKEYRAPKILIGHSLGGAAVLQAAAAIPLSVAVATIAAPCEPSHLKRLLGLDEAEIKQKGQAKITLGGKKFKIKQQFVEDLEQTHMEETIKNIKKALIIFHSPVDSIVSIDNAAYIFQAARHPKSFISLDRADHLLLDEEDSQYVGRIIGVWSRKYLSD